MDQDQKRAVKWTALLLGCGMTALVGFANLLNVLKGVLPDTMESFAIGPVLMVFGIIMTVVTAIMMAQEL
jgi:hypothetical protein